MILLVVVANVPLVQICFCLQHVLGRVVANDMDILRERTEGGIGRRLESV